LELTAHQAQHVILDRSTCSRNPVPMLVAHFLGHYGDAAERIRTESRAARMSFVDSQNGKMLGPAGPKLAALCLSRRTSAVAACCI
jgi:hypothetical protein